MIQSDADFEMNYANGLEEEDYGIIADSRDEESKEKIDDSTLVETESDINFAQGGEITNTGKPPMIFRSRVMRSDLVGPQKPQSGLPRLLMK